MMDARRRGGGMEMRRLLLFALLLVVLGTALWWAAGRWTADERRLVVRHAEIVAPAPTPAIETEPDRIRILAWNIAHGRGEAARGWFRNWQGGTAHERAARLARIARVLREESADVVILNEVDFNAAWSGGENQAEILAQAAGYPFRVEQRNVDVRTPLGSFAFGNAVLSRLPLREVHWIDLPAHSRLESAVVGANAAALVRLETPRGPIAVIPIHLESRSEAIRLSAVAVLDSLRAREPAPLVLAGDFNTAPPEWRRTDDSTAMGRLLESGWRSPRALSMPDSVQPTFPSGEPERALDWILAEPPLIVESAAVLTDAFELSDHLPVKAVVRVPDRR